MTQYYCTRFEEITITDSLPATARPFIEALPRVLPPQISTLHESLARWFDHGLSPGEITPERIWIDESNDLYFAFGSGQKPSQLMQTGLAIEIGSWLVLLACWMETFVVIARARAVWSPDELAGALTFLTPAFLPPTVTQLNPNWEQVAQAVALAVADGPLAGTPKDRHWRPTGEEAGANQTDPTLTKTETVAPSNPFASSSPPKKTG